MCGVRLCVFAAIGSAHRVTNDDVWHVLLQQRREHGVERLAVRPQLRLALLASPGLSPGKLTCHQLAALARAVRHEWVLLGLPEALAAVHGLGAAGIVEADEPKLRLLHRLPLGEPLLERRVARPGHLGSWLDCSAGRHRFDRSTALKVLGGLICSRAGTHAIIHATHALSTPESTLFHHACVNAPLDQSDIFSRSISMSSAMASACDAHMRLSLRRRRCARVRVRGAHLYLLQLLDRERHE